MCITVARSEAFFSAGAWEKCKTDAFFSGPPAGNATAQHKSEVMKGC